MEEKVEKSEEKRGGEQSNRTSYGRTEGNVNDVQSTTENDITDIYAFSSL